MGSNARRATAHSVHSMQSGCKALAAPDFTVHSVPRIGTYLLGIYGGIVVGVTLWHLIAARIRAARKDREQAHQVPAE